MRDVRHVQAERNGANMALALIAQVDYVDGKNKSSFTRVRVPTGFTIAQYTSFVLDLAQAVKNISGCLITGASINLSFSLEGLGLNTIASSAANVAAKMFLKIKSAVAGFFAKMSIPTFLGDTLVVAGTDEIDLADTDVATLVTLLEDGNGTVIPCDKYGNALSTTDIARELFAKHNG